MPESTKKDMIFPVIIMVAVCTVMTVLLAGADALTRDRIAALEVEADAGFKRNILPAAMEFSDLEVPAGQMDVTAVVEGTDAAGKSVGLILTSASRGYGGLVTVMTGFDPDGKILAVQVVKDDETPGLGKKVREDAFLHAFIGKEASAVFTVKPDDTTKTRIDSVSGATISSRGVVDAVNKSCAVYLEIMGGELMPLKLSPFKQLSNGIIRENPVFRLVLGTCPALAITTQAMNGLGMGVAVIFVLVCSNVLISMLRNIIPNKVRIPVFITIIAAFVAIVQMVIQAFIPSLYEALGIFIPLITVNCIILARAEAFASKNSVLSSALDGLGMGLGATLALVLMGSIREILGNGTIFGAAIPILRAGGAIQPMLVFILPPGGFFVYGILIALTIKLVARMDKISEAKVREQINVGNCAACPAAGLCGKVGDPTCDSPESAVPKQQPPSGDGGDRA